MKIRYKTRSLVIFGILILVSFPGYFILNWHSKVAKSLSNAKVIARYLKLTNLSKPERVELGTDLKKELELRLEAAAKDKKIIILWAPPFGQTKIYKSIDKNECGDCDVTYDNSMIDDNRTGAIIYHFDHLKWSKNMPEKRNPNHLHILWTMESPSTMKKQGITFETEDKYGMNATMSHRRDSDFLSSYELGRILKPLMGQSTSIYDKIMKDKSKLAVTAISDCSEIQGAVIRLNLVKQLKEAGLRIDSYGTCFSNPIGKELTESIHQYKFYFAYENSYHCRDYITEKFFANALMHDTVPVVWGATKNDYEAIAPPGSYIHSEDFDSPEDLIAYLEFLDNNDTEYLKYFRWRTMEPEEAPLFQRKVQFCVICRAIHGINVDDRFNPKYDRSSIPLFTDGVAKRSAPAVGRYIYEEDNTECFHPAGYTYRLIQLHNSVNTISLRLVGIIIIIVIIFRLLLLFHRWK